MDVSVGATVEVKVEVEVEVGKAVAVAVGKAACAATSLQRVSGQGCSRVQITNGLVSCKSEPA